MILNQIFFKYIFLAISVSNYRVISIYAEEVNTKFPVVLNDLSYGHNVIGSKIQLACQTILHANYASIEWNIPKLITQKTQTEDTYSSGVRTSVLVIEDPPQTGLYSCNVTVHGNKSVTLQSNQLSITLYGTEISFADIEPIENYFSKVDAEVNMNIIAHPNLALYWTDHRNKVIDNSSSNIVSQLSAVGNSNYNYKAKLSFSNITEDDLGRYVANIGSSITRYQIPIEIKIDEQVESSLTTVSLNEDTKNVTFECKAVGNPKPNITWTFERCNISDDVIYNNRDNCSAKHLILNGSHVEDRGLQVISYISLNSSYSGILKCITRNDESVEYIFHVPNGFDLIVNSSTQHEKKVNFGFAQLVHFLCLISYQKYLNYQEWYLNDELIIAREGKHKFYRVQNLDHFQKLMSRLSFILYKEEQLGNYTCLTVTKTGEIVRKTVELVPKRALTLYPQISLQDLNGGHTTAGEDVRLLCNITFTQHFQVVWKFIKRKHKGSIGPAVIPSELENHIDKQKFKQHDVKTLSNSNDYITTSYLTVSKANTPETGYYECEMEFLKDSEFTLFYDDYIWVQIYDVNIGDISFHNNSRFNGENMKIEVYMTAHPPPMIQWFDNKGNEIRLKSSNTSNFLISFQQIFDKTNTDTNYEVSVTFKNFTSEDFGNYTIVAENEYKEVKHTIPVNVTGVPSTKIDIHSFSEKGTILKCSAIAFPKPTIQWYFKKCTTLSSCLDFSEESKSDFVLRKELRNESEVLQHISYISINLSERGIWRCQSKNKFGKDSKYEPILGYGNKFEVFVDGVNAQNWNQSIEVKTKDKLNCSCAASYNYTKEFAVFYGDSREPLNVPRHHPYTARGLVTERYYLLSSFALSKITVNIEGDSYYSCSVLNKDGFLKTRNLHFRSQPNVFVRFSDTNMQNNSDIHVDIGDKLLFFCYIDGFPKPTLKWYKNDKRILSSKTFKFSKNEQVLEINDASPDDEGTYVCEASNRYTRNITSVVVYIDVDHTWMYVQFFLLLFACLFIGTLAYIKFKKDKYLIENFQLIGFSYSDQSTLIGINPKLGIENQANLLPYDQKWEIPLEKIKLGKQLGSGAFGVILQANVINHFPDDPNKTAAVKTVDPLSGFECLKALASEVKIMSHLGKHLNVVNLLGACTEKLIKGRLYMVLEFCSFGNILDYIRRRCNNFIDQKHDDGVSFKWSSDDTVDFDTKDSITSKDLLVWSFQIARGMDYLGSRKIVHGDLAARNVLLTDNNVVKVCDFGLAEHMYNYSNYVKKQGRLPIKWMAVEAIERGIFSTQSDVWAFGVVLWEIFSLGKTPYAGIDVDKEFSKMLIDGYRMEQPPAATADIYKFMLDCWNIDPLLRPSFAILQNEIGFLLDRPVRNYYVSMNDEYMLMNQQQFNNGEDYLTMVLTPTYENIISQLSENSREPN